MAETVWTTPRTTQAGSLAVDITTSIYPTNVGIVFASFDSNSSASSVAASHDIDGAMTRIGTFQTGSGSCDVFWVQDMSLGTITVTWSGGGIPCSLTAVAVENATGISANTQATGSSATPSIAAAGSSGNRIIGYCSSRGGSQAMTVTESTAISGGQLYDSGSGFTSNITADDYNATLDHTFNAGAAGSGYCIRSIALTMQSGSAFVYDSAREGFLSGTLDWDADNIRAVLIDAGTYTVNLAAHANYSDLSGIVGTESGLLTGKTTVNGIASADSVTFSSVTGNTIEAVVLFKDTGNPATDSLICYLTLGTGLPFTPNGSDISITWNPTGIFKI